MLQSQGYPRIVAYALVLLRSVDLKNFSVATAEQFASALDVQTNLSVNGFPDDRKEFGSGSKVSQHISQVRSVLQSIQRAL
ncbi:hypothetical protein QN395_21155 [Undibacterium sp. RTI2.2]|nr:hypothetical protein [Undibacterium sp. RTI2.2]